MCRWWNKFNQSLNSRSNTHTHTHSNTGTFKASKHGKIEVLGFLWSLVEHGIRTQKIHEDKRLNKHTDPEPSPTMAGGLFSVDRDYFFELGGYDEDFGFWGAENLEFSFRIWQCGGTIEVMPCSRVYHIFRKGGKPYKTNTGDVMKNKLRTAAIWMDDYAQYVCFSLIEDVAPN